MAAKKHKGKTIIGLTEKVKLYGKKGTKTVIARIDTGATKSSVDLKLVGELNLGSVVKTTVIKSAHGNSLRPIIRTKINFKDRDMSADFTVADRSHMRYRVLIGQNILKKGFLIDPSKK